MTSEEFEQYLVSIGGLQSGIYADRPPITSNICECGEGWLQLIHDLIEELIAAGWNKQVRQIKEKFGGLRFYAGGLNSECDDIIDKYTLRSIQTCEVCGKPGTLRDDRHHAQTLCDEHNIKESA